MDAGKPLTVMIVSDLHATSAAPGDDAGSWITTTTSRDNSKHPLFALRKLIDDEQLDIDLLLCAGDITNQADQAAMANAWTELNDLATHSNSQLIAATGNHDLDSRLSKEVDPRGFLYDLEPIYPTDSEQARADYWSKNFAIVDSKDHHDDEVTWRVVTINSSAFHGYETDEGKELDHGRVTERTAARLARDLASRSRAKVQILLVHHHIQQLPDVDLKEKSQILDVEHLLAFLERSGPWLVIHGHKHRPHVFYAQGGGASAAIFSSASLAAFSYGQLSSANARNQVHVVELASEDERDKVELGIAARFFSWTWRPNIGWSRAATDSGLPGSGGFGWRLSPTSFARRISRNLSIESPAMNREELLLFEPKLRYISPPDLTSLTTELQRLGVATELTSAGELNEVRQKMVRHVPEEQS